MRRYTKLPTDIPTQIEVLKKRGLVFLNEEQAREHLALISYFRLANYWRPMEADKERHTFKMGSTFENALRIYRFDETLRSVLFPAIQRIEIILRTKIIHHVSLQYGSFWFAKHECFANPTIFERCLKNITDEVNRSKEDFIAEHFKKYDTPPYPPAWKALEVSSFGTLSKLYCNLSDITLKKKIARDFGLPQHIYFESWIKSLTILRNDIAHHARLWNRKFPLRPQIPKKLVDPWITYQEMQTERLYAPICCMAYILSHFGWGKDLKHELSKLLNDYPTIDLHALGFPEEWLKEGLWKQN